MKTTLKHYSVAEISEGFVFNEFEGRGLFGLSGKLTIQPEYQRNYIYEKENKDVDVVISLLKEYPLGLIYFVKVNETQLEVLDGQQRITSFGRYITGKFAVKDENGMQQYFNGLAADKQQLILNADLLVYECEGTETEIKEWFKTINISGIPLTPQELLNSVYSGPFVTLGKEEFSNSSNANIQKWSVYILGSPTRQEIWERALEWISKGRENIGGYMSLHRFDNSIKDVKTYFESVIEWASTTFTDVKKEMRGLEWGRLYEDYHKKSYNSKTISVDVQKLYGDPFVQNRKGIFEYILGGKKDTKLLDVRVFDDATRQSTYAKQSSKANSKGISNCPLCAVGNNVNKTKIWKLEEMDADHVAAWSKGGATQSANCEMLCKTHNRAKGNR